VKNVDRIIVIADGTIAEIGSHSELMKKKGIYANIFESQAQGFVEGLDN
jgi:ATP-binding cassette subfamily B protein